MGESFWGTVCRAVKLLVVHVFIVVIAGCVDKSGRQIDTARTSAVHEDFGQTLHRSGVREVLLEQSYDLSILKAYLGIFKILTVL